MSGGLLRGGGVSCLLGDRQARGLARRGGCARLWLRAVALPAYLRIGAATVSAAAMVATGAAACAPAGPQLRLTTAALGLECEHPDAQVYVDEELVGRVADLGGRALPMAAGLHRLVVRRQGYLPAEVEVVLSAGITQVVRVELRPRSQ